MSTPDTSTLAGKLAVIQGAIDGAQIQFRELPGKQWADCGPPPYDGWMPNFVQFVYRIKPEPEVTWEPTGRIAWKRCQSFDEHAMVVGGVDGSGPIAKLCVERRSPSGETRWVPVEVED